MHVSDNTKNSSIYTALRDAIVNGKLRPGERLVLSDLAKRYATSAMPVREAITRLQQDGFVEVRPHVGAHVADFDAAKFKEILMIRVELESLACRQAVPHITDALLTTLEEMVAQMALCLQEADIKGFSRLNKKLHMTIYCASPYHILQDLIYNLWERSEYMRNLYSISLRRINESHLEHIEWIQALRKRDTEEVIAILRKQKEKQFAEYLRVIESN